jgi:hypothetical protein
MFKGSIKPGETLTIPNQQISNPIGKLTLMNLSKVYSVDLMLKLNLTEDTKEVLVPGSSNF